MFEKAMFGDGSLPEGANCHPPRKNCSLCHGTGEIPLPHRSGQPYIPKMASTLTLIEEILARKAQVIVFSACWSNSMGWADDIGPVKIFERLLG
ncbi:MAG: hypothetical protein ABSC89_06945 [Verrucomicrobiota bacterium]|jgi:hypothetical protein